MHIRTRRIPAGLRAALIAAAGIGPALPAQPAAPRARIVEDLRLDAVTEDFSRVRFVYVGPHGEIVVPLLQDNQLRVYDSTGTRVAVLGRQGAGPGEFRNIYPVGWKGDTMWVSDQRQRRVTYFGPDATLIRTTPNGSFDPSKPAEIEAARRTGRGIETQAVNPFAVYRDGSILGYQQLRAAGGSGSGAAAFPDPALIRIAPDGRRRIVAMLPSPEDPRWFMSARGLGRPVPFMSSPQVSVSATGDRVAHVWSELTGQRNGTFTVTAIRASGDTMFVRSFPFVGIPVSSAARDSAIDALAPRSGASEGGAAVVREFQKIAREKMPAVYAGAETLVVGMDRTIWVGLHRDGAGQPFLVLNDRGDPVASVQLPARSRLLQASASHLWVIETDDDGLGSVVRYRVSGVSCGGPGCD